MPEIVLRGERVVPTIGGSISCADEGANGYLQQAWERLRTLVEEGGFIPLPDHRMPPDCSLEQFRNYVKVFRSVFKMGV